MQEKGLWTRNLVIRCQEIVGEVGEEVVYAVFQRGERLAPAFCRKKVETRYNELFLGVKKLRNWNGNWG